VYTFSSQGYRDIVYHILLKSTITVKDIKYCQDIVFEIQCNRIELQFHTVFSPQQQRLNAEV